MALKFSNNAVSKLLNDITAAATTLTVLSGEGSKFPVLSAGETFMVTIKDSSGNIEICTCTARSGDILTVTRAAESTTARAFSAGATVSNNFTAGSMASYNTYAMASNAEATAGVLTTVLMNPSNTKYFWDQRVSTFAATMLDDSDASAVRTTLGLGDSSTKNVGTSTGTVCAGDDSRLGTGGGVKNRLCNGDFRVDNINNGSAVTPTVGAHVVDNMFLSISAASKITAQRVSSSLTGFPYSEKFTVVSAYTPSGSEIFNPRMGVEGFDIADLMWGTANAKPITVSFTIKVSVAGTYAFSIVQQSTNYSYVFTKTLSSGENYVTQTIPGPTVGTWNTGSITAFYLRFDLGSGSTMVSSTKDSWVSGQYMSYTGCVKLVSNLNATYEISGIQIEKGSTATSFEVLPYYLAEAWCQKYHPYFPAGGWSFLGQSVGSTTAMVILPFKTKTRVAPTGLVASNAAGMLLSNSTFGSSLASTAITYNSAGVDSAMVYVTCATGLTAGDATVANLGSTSIRFTGAEL